MSLCPSIFIGLLAGLRFSWVAIGASFYAHLFLILCACLFLSFCFFAVIFCIFVVSGTLRFIRAPSAKHNSQRQHPSGGAVQNIFVFSLPTAFFLPLFKRRRGG